jgi:3-hydroxyisobutyrate dehydrogenase-like beta-hydroxyacid dehydrogenase
MKRKIGFLGLGAMGSPIASRLAKEFQVTVWNRTRQRALDHSQSSKTRFVESYQDMGDMDYIFACLPSSRVSNEIFLDLHKIQPIQTTFIDITSGDYESSVELSKKLHPRRYFDAPVSGGPQGAREGTLTTMIGCRNLSTDDQLVLSAYSKAIFPCGEIGHGNAIKGANNFLNMTHLILASDVLLQLSKKGICPDIALRTINASSGRSLQTEVRIPTEVLTRKFNYGFKLNLMRKDIFQNEEILKDSLFFSRIKKLLQPHDLTEEDYTTIVKDLESVHQIELKKKSDKV